MQIKNTLSIALMLIAFQLFSQDNIYSSLTISKELKENANAVLRKDDTKIEISSIKNLKHTYLRVITILNKKGNNHVDAYVSYDDEINVKKLKATVYNQFGNEIRKFKKGDFKDVAAVSSSSLYEDSRVKYLEYTPTEYPYTVEFYYETETPNTAWIPFWRPLEGYLISTEESTFEVIYSPTVGINKKEKNFSDYNITDNSKEGVLRYNAKNLLAIKREELSPKFNDLGPKLLVTPQNFHYEGYTGTTGNWESLGKWIHDKLLLGRANVSEATKQEIINLVKDAKTPIQKSKIVYQYVQDNTRYISVQVGIGGIQPIPALEVDKVKYGDCKGLTNYTKALLDVVGVESYYTEVYASPEIQFNVDKEFASLFGQGNHVILNIPLENEESLWLECTSQTIPFGFLGDFTDNRDVFVITPEGGKIMRTPKYTVKENNQLTTGYYNILNDGSIEVEAKVVSRGIQYHNKFHIEKKERRDQEKFYKKYWKNINNINIKEIDYLNDRDAVIFTETVNFVAKNYTSAIGDKMLFVPNALNRFTNVPDRYRNRKLSLSIIRGFVDNDEYEINLPEGYGIEFIPENIVIENKFGTYNVEIEKVTPNKIKYKRMLSISEGQYPKEDYSAYRNFLKEISKNDNAKIVLTKN